MSRTPEVGFRASVVTGAHPHGEPGLVTVCQGIDDKVLVVIGVIREAPEPRLMLNLSPAEKRALILALETVP